MNGSTTTASIASALEHEDIILARIGEISLKGLNRGRFEQRLIGNLSRRLRPLGQFEIALSQSRIWIRPVTPPVNWPEVLQSAASVFGIVSVSPVWRFCGRLPELLSQAQAYCAQIIHDQKPRTFKVESRRGNKQFPLISPEISNVVGETLLQAFPRFLRVDVHHPDFVLYVEVRDQLYLYSEIVKGQKGLPVGMGGRGMLLLSGGIDSPVAGYMMASRGMELQAVYYHAFPFTSDQARDKVVELARQLAVFCGRLKLHIVGFTDIQLTLRDSCPAELLTIVMRRMMLRIADRLAGKEACQALITGESLGQVASQTIEAIQVTGLVTDLPVLRPLIGLDKDDTIQVARRIGTYETSILPYEDCCTVFVARHPRIHPRLADVLTAESGLDIEGLVSSGIENIEEVLA